MLSFALRVERIDTEGEFVDSFEVLLTDEKSSDAIDFRKIGDTTDQIWMVNRDDFDALIAALQAERERATA